MLPGIAHISITIIIASSFIKHCTLEPCFMVVSVIQPLHHYGHHGKVQNHFHNGLQVKNRIFSIYAGSVVCERLPSQ